MAKTYGDKPVCFQIEENGEYWCVGSEVSLRCIYIRVYIYFVGQYENGEYCLDGNLMRHDRDTL